MRDRSQTVLADILPPEERVIEAVVARYQRVAPAVTRFARTLSKNEELHVRLGSEAASRPGEVVLDPRLFQAAYSRSAPVTPAEVALASALHEVVHLAVTDFEEQRPIPAEWLPEDADEIAEDPVPLLDALAEAGGPAAEALFLALEDARQEMAHLSAYRGAQSVLEDMYVAASPDALAHARPLGQFALACFLIVGEYSERDRLQKQVEPHVAAALDDAMAFLDGVREATDVWEVAGRALQLLQVARLHGLLTEVSGNRMIGDEEQAAENDRDSIAEGVDRVRLTSPILQDVESYDETMEATAGDSDTEGDSEAGGDPSTEQLIRVSEAPLVYPPIGQGGKLVLGQFPDRFRQYALEGRESLDRAARSWGVAQRHISGELWPLFIANQRRGLRSGYDAGDLSPYAALFLGAGLYQRMFERRAISSRRSYAVSLLIDGSASMLQPRRLPGGSRAPWGMAAATLGAWTLARLSDELQVEFEMALFNRAFAAADDDSEASYIKRMHGSAAGLRRTQGSHAERLTRTVNHYVLKSFDQRWRSAEDVVAGLFWTAAEPRAATSQAARNRDESPPVSMFEKAANVDEYNVSYAAERLLARRATVRILVVLADGMTRGSVESLAETVRQAEFAGTTVLGIGIGDGTVQAAYGRNQVVERPDELTRAMVDGVRSSLRRSLALWGADTWWARSQWHDQDWKINA
ncbi:MAG: hypothetical protein KJP22_14945 [Acidimicrobiia bacterium]|nr:hypothetical protein [Acidimicrobiia bacterium]MBT8247756.1 hypothetical protein [Acidimicrobiia bacterium]NNJ48600.1 hypothetical protein [Acidimicrobiia bacterium]